MSAPGRRVGSGTLRVDAAKAIAKLRDYQLPDPLQWMLECYRGAVGLGAERLWAWGDADDVWLAWSGPAPEPEELARLLDVLVSPQSRADRRWARLFAIGVNTALGLEPRFLDLWSLSPEARGQGRASRVRYVPGLLSGDGERLRALAPESLPPPPELERALGDAASGGAVQLRRAFGFDVMGRYFTGRSAEELTRLRLATRDAAVGVTIAQEPPAASRDLVRLELGPELRGFVAITRDPGAIGGIMLDLAERGALLESRVLPFPGLEALRAPLPIRVYVDADRLPTNAARSAVRQDERPLSELPARVEAALPKLVAALNERVADDAEARSAALRLLASACAGPRWSLELQKLPKVLAPLAELPLLRDAVGRPRTPASFTLQEAVHFGREPFDAALAPWLGDLLFCPPGDAAHALLGDARPSNAEPRARHARRQRAIREAWLKHPTRAPTVDPAPGQLVGLRFGEHIRAPRGSLLEHHLTPKGVTGEVVLLDPATLGERRAGFGELHVLLEGRPIGVAQLEAPWPWVGVVEAPFVAEPDYRGIVVDAVYEAAVLAARAAALEAVELLAHQVDRPGDALPKQTTVHVADLLAKLVEEPALHSLPRRGASNLPGAPLSRGVLQRFRECQRAYVELAGATTSAAIAHAFRSSALARLPIWPLDDGEGHLSWTPLRKLLHGVPSESDARELRLRVPAVGYTPRTLPRRAVIVGAHDGPVLDRLFPTVQWVTYEPSRGEAITAQRLAARFATISEVAVPFDEERHGRRGVVALTRREPELWLFHRGQQLERRPLESRILRCRIAVDDDFVVPSPDATAVAADSPFPLVTEVWERALLAALIDHLGGGPSALIDQREVASLDWVREALIVGLAAGGMKHLDQARRAKVEAYPLVPHANAAPRSLHELRAEKGSLVYVPHEARVDLPLDWHPIVASETCAQSLGALVSRRAVDGRAELDRRRREVFRVRREEAIRAGARVALPGPDDGDVVALTGTIAKAGARGILRFGPSRLTGSVQVDLRVEGHAYRTLPLPAAPGGALELVGDVPRAALGPARESLLPEVESELVSASVRALGALLVRVGERAPERLVSDPVVHGALEAFVASRVRKGSKIAAQLCAIPAFPTVQGGRASIDEASTHRRVRVGQHVGVWLGPIDEDDTHALDKPVLSIPEMGGLRTIIEALAQPKKLLDHTRALRTLQAERRVRQGVMRAPTLTEIPAALKASVRALSSRGRVPALLGPGEIGLIERGPSQAGVFANGGLAGWLPVSIDPPIRAAMEIPGLADDARRTPASTGSRISEPLASLVTRLLRDQIVPKLDAHPPWVRAAVRRAFSSKLLTAEDLDGAAVFETTDDRWIGTRALYDQAETFGEVWYTTRTSPEERSRRPLDDKRLVLRLTSDEVKGLAQHVPLHDAAKRLEREDRARRNLAKPRVTELFFSTRVRPHLLAEAEFGRGKRRGVIGVLAEPSTLEGLNLFREGLPLGTVPHGFDWPLVALAESDALQPDETYDAVIEDRVVDALRKTIAKRAEQLLDELIDEPGLRVARKQRIEARHASALGGAGALRGVVGLRDDLDPGRVITKVGGRTEHFDPDVQPTRGGSRRALPVDGLLLAAMSSTATPIARLNAVVRVAYVELITTLVTELRAGAPSDDLQLAHVAHAVSLGLYTPTPRDVSVVFRCFHPRPLTLPQLHELFASDDAFPVRDPGEGKLPKKLVALLADGTRTSEQIELGLGSRARRTEPVELVTDEAIAAENAKRAEQIGPAEGATQAAPAEDATQAERTRPRPSERAHASAAKPPSATSEPPDSAARASKFDTSKSDTSRAKAPVERAKAHPLDPLAEHLLAQLAALGLPERIQQVRLDDRAKTLARYEAEPRILWIAGRHPSLVALQAARIVRSADAERAMRVLVAHVVGVLDRASASVTEATQLGVFGALLTT